MLLKHVCSVLLSTILYRLKNIDETRNYLIEEINWNKLTSKKHKKIYRTLNYIGQFQILASTIAECVSIFAFAPLISTSVRVTSSAIRLKICAITAAIKKYKPIIKKKKKKHDEMVLLVKSKFNSTEVLISIGTCDSVVS